MRLWRFYLRALLRRPLYVFAVLAALAGVMFLHGGAAAPPADAKGGLVIASFVAAYMLRFVIDPRKLLVVSPFMLGLPATRERLGTMLWVALSLPVLGLLWPFYGFSIFWGFHALSLLELSLLSVGSVLAWLFLPLSAAALVATCAADRWPLFLLLGVPYLVAGGLWLGGRLPSRHWQGFRYVPRYAAPVALSLAGFDLYQRLTHTAMRFHLGDFFGLQAPDFDNLLLLLLFLAGGVLFMLLPFLNTLALRQVEGELLAIRQMTGTPWKRRVGALFLALLLNLPVAWLMHALDFVTSPALLPWHFALSASCFNVLFLTSTEETDWTGYALVGYLLWIHMVPSSGAAWIWDLALGMAALLAYDVDLWLPPLLQKIRRAFGEFFWDEG